MSSKRLARVRANDAVTMVRISTTGRVDGTFTLTATRVTPKRVYFTRDRYVDKETGILAPKYLDYMTYAAGYEPQAAPKNSAQ
jgi:hypothetical protein